MHYSTYHQCLMQQTTADSVLVSDPYLLLMKPEDEGSSSTSLAAPGTSERKKKKKRKDLQLTAAQIQEKVFVCVLGGRGELNKYPNKSQMLITWRQDVSVCNKEATPGNKTCVLTHVVNKVWNLKDKNVKGTPPPPHPLFPPQVIPQKQFNQHWRTITDPGLTVSSKTTGRPKTNQRQTKDKPQSDWTETVQSVLAVTTPVENSGANWIPFLGIIQSY